MTCSSIVQHSQPWNLKHWLLPLFWVAVAGPPGSRSATAMNAEQARPEVVTSSVQQDTQAAAQQAFEVAERLRSEGTAPSLELALERYQHAFQLWRQLGDRRSEAITLDSIGRVYNSLGEKQKALDYYNQALLFERAVGDRSAEATTLNNIGVIYDSLGEKQKALDYFNQALPLERAVGDRSGEAKTLNNIGVVYDSLGKSKRRWITSPRSCRSSAQWATALEKPHAEQYRSVYTMGKRKRLWTCIVRRCPSSTRWATAPGKLKR